MTPTFDDDVYEDGNQFKDDDKLVVMFSLIPVPDPIRSAQEGRRCFIDVEHITIIIPGQRDTVVAEVDDHYKRRFAAKYKKWKDMQADPETGTPLEEIPWLSPSQIWEFKALNVKTIEQLVGLPDSSAQRFVGYSDIKRKAERFLSVAKDAAPDMKLELALQERDAQLATQAEQIKQLTAAVEKLTAKK